MHGMSSRLETCWGPYVKELSKKFKAKFFAPQCTLKKDITFNSWVEELDKYSNEIDENSIFVCHSLSTLFIVKYLKMRNLKPLAVIAVSGGRLDFIHDEDYSNINDFIVNKTETDYFAKNVKHRFNIHSNNDDIWTPEQIAYYSNVLKATDITLNGGGHLGSHSGITEIKEIDQIINEIKKNNQVEI